jgi:hypothetical protein
MRPQGVTLLTVMLGGHPCLSIVALVATTTKCWWRQRMTQKLSKYSVQYGNLSPCK